MYYKKQLRNWFYNLEFAKNEQMARNIAGIKAKEFPEYISKCLSDKGGWGSSFEFAIATIVIFENLGIPALLISTPKGNPNIKTISKDDVEAYYMVAYARGGMVYIADPLADLVYYRMGKNSEYSSLLFFHYLRVVLQKGEKVTAYNRFRDYEDETYAEILEDPAKMILTETDEINEWADDVQYYLEKI